MSSPGGVVFRISRNSLVINWLTHNIVDGSLTANRVCSVHDISRGATINLLHDLVVSPALRTIVMVVTGQMQIAIIKGVGVQIPQKGQI